MKTYRTTFNIPASELPLTYQKPAMFIGSCFTENIGTRLQDLKFQVDINPFGVIYNPWSVKNSLDLLIKQREFSKEDLYFYDNQWISFYHQTSFSHPDLAQCLKTINNGIRQSAAFLQASDFLFITFGTARVYEWKENNQVVSNCHKIPSKQFSRRLLSPKEITNMYAQVIEDLSEINPGLKIVFTVSPIRHWKDGAIGNQVSKATLLLAIRNLVEQFPQTGYFPAYEIVMDDLRDYRFYAEDMIHLNKSAVDYIWEKFVEVYFDNETKIISAGVDKLLQAFNHRPMKSDSEAHKTFLLKHLQLTRELSQKYPFIDFKKEMEYFSGKN